MLDTPLPEWSRVLVVIAHPDDESFGLGAVIDSFVGTAADVAVLCFTQGEASTLGADLDDLAGVRARELSDAAHALGVTSVELLNLPDGRLADVDADERTARVADSISRQRPDGLLVFDTTGITGHPDHRAATESAVTAASAAGLPVLAWTLSSTVADALSRETGVEFLGRTSDECDLVVTVDRTRQRDAVLCHPSQAVPGSALWRRLELQGDREYLRWLRR